MNNESAKSEEAPIEDVTELQNEAPEQVEADEATLTDELTQADFRIEELEKELAEAQAKVVEQQDSVVRAAAEVENIRRRAALDVEKAHKFALEKFANELLPVIDNMERALIGSETVDESGKALLEGVELTLKSFISVIEKFGLKAVDPTGEAFDHEHHQAIGMQASDEFAANTVMVVMQKGYLLNDRLLRPAMVMVSTGPEAS